jgi:small subunit ribosomal protein S17
MDKNRKGPIVARGKTKVGIVISDRNKKTVTVEWDTVKYFRKYQRYARSKSKIHAHNPESINASVGDLVEISECRKISKTKAWIVTKIIKKAAELLIEKKGAKAISEEVEKLEKSKLVKETPKVENKKEAV